MRILVTSTPGTGHIHPMLPLVVDLHSRGHRVLWATGPASCHLVEAFGIATTPAGPDLLHRNARFASSTEHLRDLPPRERRREAMPLMFGELSAPVMRDALRPVFDDFRPELVIHEVAELAAAPLASARGLPHVTVAFSDVVPAAIADRVAASVAPIWMEEGLAPASDAGWFDHLYLHPFPPSMTAGRHGLTPMRPVGVDLPDAVRATVPAWIDAFGSERPGIYLTFGTEYGRLAPWSALITALGDLDVDVAITAGNQALVAEIEAGGVLPPHIHLEAWVPQALLLERAALVVSHAGAGTLLAASRSGVPQLCIPIAADQWDNADALGRAGAGIVADVHERTADQFARSIEALLAGAADVGAAHVAAEIAEMPTPARIAPLVEALVDAESH
jgi:UDP:flavonoid glycosyltransferase YjiC (YdhE family)